LLTASADLHGDLIVGSADALGSNINAGLHVLDGLVEDLD
jgi:hypothetical protein